MLRSWQKYCNFWDDSSPQESIQKDKENIEEVNEASSMTSEEIHGGEEATKDIQGSPNTTNEGEQEQEKNQASGNISEDSNNGSVLLNNGSVPSDFSLDNKNLKRELAVIISKIADDIIPVKADGDDYWDIEELMLRRVTKRNINNCKTNYVRNNLIIGLDFSGSCDDYSRFFSTVLRDAVVLGACKIYDASNGFYNGMFEFESDEIVKDYLKEFAGKTVIFFGDFDGGDSIVKLSKVAKVYWFSCEDRYDDMDEHSWCNFRLSDFRGKYYKCFNEQDFVKLCKKIR